MVSKCRGGGRKLSLSESHLTSIISKTTNRSMSRRTWDQHKRELSKNVSVGTVVPRAAPVRPNMFRFWLFFEYSQLQSFISITSITRFDICTQSARQNCCPWELAAIGAISNPLHPTAYPGGGIKFVSRV